MTVKAFILIDTSPGKAKEVAQKLRGVQGVTYAHTVTGPHDIIAMVESADVSSLGELVVHNIQSIAACGRSQWLPYAGRENSKRSAMYCSRRPR